ncbi:MAG: pseudouridine synthase [Bacteroidota bacterium]
MPRYFLIYKPYNMLSQFTKEAEHHVTLAELHDFPPKVYPVGRLDKDSEGLLILTDDTKLNAKLLHPNQRHERRYLAQVEGIPGAEALDQLRKGIEISVNKKKHKTRPARITLPDAYPDFLPERNPPVRYRANIPTSFIQLHLTEGKNRQVRKMCAKVGYPVLRLVRTHIVSLSLNDLKGQAVREVEGRWLYDRLFGEPRLPKK